MKNSFLFIAALFPLLSFSFTQEEIRDKVTGCYRYYYSDNYSVKTAHFTGKLPAVESYLKVNDIAIETTTSFVNYPDFSDLSYSTTNLYSSETAVRCIEVNTTKYAPLNTFPSLYVIYNFATSLYAAGYRGSGFKLFQDISASRAKFNFNYSLAVADISASTNVVFRQILLSHLSSISADINSIGVSVNSINSDYQQFNYLALNPDYAAFVNRQASPATSNGGPSQSSNLQSLLNPNDPRSYERSRALAELSRDNLKAVVSAIDDPSSEFYGNDINTVLSNSDMFQRAIQQGGGGGSVASIARDIKKLSTNDWVSAVTNDLANNRASITNQLSQNTEDIKNELLHIFEDNDPSTTGRAIRDIAGNASTLASAVHNNRVVVTVENTTPVSVLLDGPVNIDQSQLIQLSTPLAGLQSRIDTWYQDWYSFYSPNVSGYNWIHFFDMVSSFKDVNHTDFVSLQSCVSNLLVSLRGDITNSVVSTNGYLLLSDYADYIHSGGLDSLLDVMDDDSYSDLKSEIGSLYHVDTSEGYGRWWRYFTGLSTVQANSIFKLSNIFLAHEKLLKDLKRDNSDLDVSDASDSSVFRKLLYTIPSDEDTFNKLSQLTNSIDQSGMVRVQQLIPDLTNRFNLAATLYDHDFVLPSEISWTLIPEDSSLHTPARVVSIRPSEHYRLFQLLHFGLAFSYCLVNIILLPKFLLFLVRLFDRVWNKSEKLIYNSTQS